MTLSVQPKLNLTDLPKKEYNGWSDWTTWNCALWINGDEGLYSIAKECKTYSDFLYEMQYICGFHATPDGADWGEADITEMEEMFSELHEDE